VKAGRGPLLGVWLAVCFHGPLVAAGLYRYGWDATTHLFFADHYRRSWFGLWEPRWFGGFSVSSYPPLVHQLLALLSLPFGYDGAFAVLLLSTLVVFSVAVWRFAQLFVPPAAASGAAVVAVFLPGMALAAYLYGQLPTLVALTLTLFLVFECTRFVERGGGFGIWLIAALAGTAFAAHHATPLLFLPPALLAGLSTVLLGVDASVRAARLRRAVMTVAAVALAGTVAIVPFWLWADGGIHQAFIPHNSRANFLVDFGAQAVYLWGVYGVLPALALFGLRLRPDRRTAAVAILAGALGILGLGGTTPIPSLVFGPQWQWLTYDRFALWGAVALLPLAGLAVDRLVSARMAVIRALGIAALGGLLAYSSANAVLALLGPALPYQRDLRPIADFMNDGRAQWRYQTFGVGNDAVRLGIMTPAATIDGAYYSARRVPELTTSGIGMLDGALWWDPSGSVLRRVLARANAYSIRWAFVVDPHYDGYLLQAGFAPREALAGGIAVWENPTAPPVRVDARGLAAPDFPGILWGTLPLAFAVLTLGFALVRRWTGLPGLASHEPRAPPVSASPAASLASPRGYGM
jgi:hypothetical protein